MNATTRIPIDFLNDARLSWSDVRFGLSKGFIDLNDAVRIAMDKLSREDDGSPTEIELAGLLRNELHRVPELIGVLTANEYSETDAKKKWLSLVLAWLFKQRNEMADPLGVVELIYADFDYPEDMACFVRYMPPTDGYRPQDHSPEENRERLFRLWHEYLLRHHPI